MVEWKKVKDALWKIFYSTSFTAVFLLIMALVLLSPSDAVYQAYKVERWVDIIIMAGVYVLTGIVAILLYASRLYTNRSILRDIPKTYLPIEKEDLPGWRVRGLIEDRLDKSAVTAYLAKPRPHRVEVDSVPLRGRISDIVKLDASQLIDEEPTWGNFGHPGWTSPAQGDLPSNLHFETVVRELPDLIEAKAVSLAPKTQVDEDSAVENPAMPDPAMVDMLQRQPAMGMREYFGQLTILGMMKADSEVNRTFLAAYERARYAPPPVSAPDFRVLMNLFAEVLHEMMPLEEAVAAELLQDESLHTPQDEGSTQDSKDSEEGSVRHLHVRPEPAHKTDLHAGSDDDGDDERSLKTAPLVMSRSNRSTSRPSLGSRMRSTTSGRSYKQARSEQSPTSRTSGRS